MKKLVVLFLGVSLLASCIFVNYLLSDDDLVWMSPYEYGDTIVFKSAIGIDSMVITGKRISNNYEYIAHSIGPTEHQGSAAFYGKMCHIGDSLEVLFKIQKNDETTLRFLIGFSERTCWKYRLYADSHLSSKRVKGIDYNDLACIDSVDMEWPKHPIRSPYNIKNMYWSKSKGLIQYEYLPTDSTQGDVYTYYKKLPYKPK